MNPSIGGHGARAWAAGVTVPGRGVARGWIWGWLMLAGWAVQAAEPAPAWTSGMMTWLAAQTNIQTWSAEVVQTRELKTLSQPLVSTGRVWFAAPNQFRWEMGQPPKTIAVRQTNQMSVVYPQLKRVERYSLAGPGMGAWKDFLAVFEAGFPRSRIEFERQFRLLRNLETNGLMSLVLEPKAAAARKMIPELRLSFGLADQSLRRTELVFVDGSVMKNEFFHPLLNAPLPENIFAPPIGADFKVVEPLAR